MNEPLWTLLLKVIVAPIIAAGLASYITYLFSHRRFIKERWWDRKADAYGNIIGSLVNMIHSLSSWIEKEYSGAYSQEALNVITSEYNKARTQIEYAATEGDYVISEKASNALSDLIKKLESVPHEFASSSDWVGCLHTYHTAVKSCLKVIRAEAQSDLRVK